MNTDSLIKDSVLEGLDTAVAVFDKEMRLETANSAFSRLWSLEMTWLSLRPNLEEVFERLRVKRSLPEVSDFGEFKQKELEKFDSLSDIYLDMMFLPDGRTLRRLIKPNGKGGLIYSFQDISEYLKLQRSVKEMGAVQRETLDNLYEGVAVFGSDGKLKLHNQTFARLWNLEENTVLSGSHLSDVMELTRPLVICPKENDEWTDPDWNEYKSRIVAVILRREQSAGRVKLKNGKVIDYINVPLPDGAVMLSYMDVTDNDRIERVLSERAQALEDANYIKSEFIANVSREIRSPLNKIVGYAEMLGQGYFGALNLRQEEYANGISFTSKNLISVVSDILELAMMDAGQMEFSFEPIDIHELLASALKLIKNRAKQKQLKIEFYCPTDIGWMMGDNERLKQVFYKLLSNSVRYTYPRGSVVLRAERKKESISISLSDTGIGIPKDEKVKIFEPFHKVGLNKNKQKDNEGIDSSEDCGVGLGLTIVKRFVELHDGKLEVKSQMGRGTAIICRFPSSREDTQNGSSNAED